MKRKAEKFFLLIANWEDNQSFRNCQHYFRINCFNEAARNVKWADKKFSKPQNARAKKSRSSRNETNFLLLSLSQHEKCVATWFLFFFLSTSLCSFFLCETSLFFFFLSSFCQAIIFLHRSKKLSPSFFFRREIQPKSSMHEKNHEKPI